MTITLSVAGTIEVGKVQAILAKGDSVLLVPKAKAARAGPAPTTKRWGKGKLWKDDELFALQYYRSNCWTKPVRSMLAKKLGRKMTSITAKSSNLRGLEGSSAKGFGNNSKTDKEVMKMFRQNRNQFAKRAKVALVRLGLNSPH